MANEVVVRFGEVSYAHDDDHVILDEASFSVRAGTKVVLMGQNGAGKSTMFGLMTGKLKPNSGQISLDRDATVAIAEQVMDPKYLDLPVREYFATAFVGERPYNLDKRIADVMEAVNADIPLDKPVRGCSGGQQARLLLAYALIQEPDILLLDEPTNNLDQAGIDHLTGFLMVYDKTCIVISHDAEFLNAFADGVLYLDVFTHKVEQYSGNYYDVVEEITNRVERERMQNARMEKEIREMKAKAEVFAHKGGKLRAVAKRMRDKAEEAEESKVDVRREDKTIRSFEIPMQEFPYEFDGKVLTLDSVTFMSGGELTTKQLGLEVRRGTHVLFEGPNGAGKTTLLDAIARGTAPGAHIGKGVKVGYYSQNFSTLNYEQRAYDCLADAMDKNDDQFLRATAAGFFITGSVLEKRIGTLSEGQKGLLSFARLMLLRPGLLILDEPTNHINFRHLPVIAQALSSFEGGMLMVSHIPDFVQQVRIDRTVTLKK
jgi:ATP-binding cassette subfamily F protein 3